MGKGWSRGMQLVGQRRSAKRLSGRVGYTLFFANQSHLTAFTQTPSTQYLPSLEDQRHSLNAFAIYRWTPSINLSRKPLYGSGFPVFVAAASGPVPPRIQCLPTYAHLDFHIDKNWAFTRWKTTLYGEVLNVTNHNNLFATGFQSGNPQPVMAKERGLPVVPAAGLGL